MNTPRQEAQDQDRIQFESDQGDKALPEGLISPRPDVPFIESPAASQVPLSSRDKPATKAEQEEPLSVEPDKFQVLATERQGKPVQIIEQERDVESYFGFNPATDREGMLSRRSSMASILD